MSIVINDTRNQKKGVLWKDLERGEVYVDKLGNYVMFTDEDTLVDLDTGILFACSEYQIEYDEFTPVKAKLEIY